MKHIECLFRLRLESLGVMLALKGTEENTKIFPGAVKTFTGSHRWFTVDGFARKDGAMIVTLSPPISGEVQEQCRRELMATGKWISISISADEGTPAP